MSTQLGSVRSFLEGRTAEAPRAPGARVVVVGSGKGGVGTSTVAALLALVAADAGTDVLLVDAADGLGVLHLLLGVDAGRELGSLRGGELEPAELVVPVVPGLSLLAAGADPLREPPLAPAERRALFRRVGEVFPGHGLVVIDGGSRLESVLAACEAGVGLLLTVTNADRICLAATYALVKAVGSRLGDRPVAVLGNRLDDDVAREAASLVESASRHFLERSILFAGSIPDDACLSAGIAAGMPVQDAATGSPAAAAMQIAVATMSNHIPPALATPAARQLQRRP
jgi:flagellar biosynthesis protein FlhG